MSLPFLLEIGTEEIPDWMIDGALDSLYHAIATIPGIDKLYLDATPRRLAVRVPNVPERQRDVVHRISGPAVGAPDAALAGFARKQELAIFGNSRLRNRCPSEGSRNNFGFVDMLCDLDVLFRNGGFASVLFLFFVLQLLRFGVIECLF